MKLKKVTVHKFSDTIQKIIFTRSKKGNPIKKYDESNELRNLTPYTFQKVEGIRVIK